MHPALETLAVIRDALTENQLDAAKALQAEVDGEWCEWRLYKLYRRIGAKHFSTPFDVQQAQRDHFEAKVRRSALPNQLRIVVDPAMPRDRIMLVNGDIASGRLIFRDGGTFVVD